MISIWQLAVFVGLLGIGMAEHKCGKNEIQLDCLCEHRCEELVFRCYLDLYCEENRCQCHRDYARNHEGKCIPRSKCPKAEWNIPFHPKQKRSSQVPTTTQNQKALSQSHVHQHRPDVHPTENVTTTTEEPRGGHRGSHHTTSSHYGGRSHHSKTTTGSKSWVNWLKSLFSKNDSGSSAFGKFIKAIVGGFKSVFSRSSSSNSSGGKSTGGFFSRSSGSKSSSSRGSSGSRGGGSRRG